MAIIAIFCDGTWNRYDGAGQTHVARLARATAELPDQRVFYFEGVGTGTGMVSALGHWASRVGGGLFGWGLNRNIKAAYRALCTEYREGDKIMLFGFSRGAYTARSLVGLIRKCGILADPTARNVNEAFALYRLRGGQNAPDTPGIWAARRRLSPRFATSQEDILRRADDSALVRITYLGVWDTVGALGIPKSILGPVADLWNARHAFHDTRLTRLVENARHAVALDEKRVMFAPGLWDNLEEKGGDKGLNRGDTGAERPYQQLWFSGNHGIVGGSSAPEGLAAASIAWIWAGARQCGLSLKPDHPVPSVGIDVSGFAPHLYKVRWQYRFAPWLLTWRSGPDAPHQLHPTARLRAALVPDYRPKSLMKVLHGYFRDL